MWKQFLKRVTRREIVPTVSGPIICVICTDIMRGKVTLKCEHEMCPECFAYHSRVNHVCPFCRAPFALPVLKK